MIKFASGCISVGEDSELLVRSCGEEDCTNRISTGIGEDKDDFFLEDLDDLEEARLLLPSS